MFYLTLFVKEEPHVFSRCALTRLFFAFSYTLFCANVQIFSKINKYKKENGKSYHKITHNLTCRKSIFCVQSSQFRKKVLPLQPDYKPAHKTTMTQYESEVKYISAPVERVYAMLSNLENLRPVLSMAQDNDTIRQQMEQAGQDPSMLDSLKDVQLTEDRIAIPAPMVGELSLRIIEREENKTIKFATEQSPVDANLWIQVLPTTSAESQEATKMRLTLKADLNPMLKMMVGNKIKSGLDKFADMLCMINY